MSCTEHFPHLSAPLLWRRNSYKWRDGEGRSSVMKPGFESRYVWHQSSYCLQTTQLHFPTKHWEKMTEKNHRESESKLKCVGGTGEQRGRTVVGIGIGKDKKWNLPCGPSGSNRLKKPLSKEVFEWHISPQIWRATGWWICESLRTCTVRWKMIRWV